MLMIGLRDVTMTGTDERGNITAPFQFREGEQVEVEEMTAIIAQSAGYARPVENVSAEDTAA
jgi:hypothetical protein